MPATLLSASLGLAAVLGLGLAAPLAQAPTVTPLNVKTGYWQSQTTVTMQGGLALPPEEAARLTPEQRAKVEAAMGAMGSGAPRQFSGKGCLTSADLTTDPFRSLNRSQGGEQCTGTLLSSSASDVAIRETCTGQGAMEFTLKIHARNSEHATADGDGNFSMGGRTMKTHYHSDMTWIGPSCPADSQPQPR